MSSRASQRPSPRMASRPSESGFCLDTAHAWGAGIDVGRPAAIDDLVAAFDDRIGLERLVMIHLNDSRSERGSRTDRHEHLAPAGSGRRVSAHVLRHPGLAHAAYLLETPGMDEGYDAINMRARPRTRRRPSRWSPSRRRLPAAGQRQGPDGAA